MSKIATDTIDKIADIRNDIEKSAFMTGQLLEEYGNPFDFPAGVNEIMSGKPLKEWSTDARRAFSWMNEHKSMVKSLEISEDYMQKALDELQAVINDNQKNKPEKDTQTPREHIQAALKAIEGNPKMKDVLTPIGFVLHELDAAEKNTAA